MATDVLFKKVSAPIVSIEKLCLALDISKEELNDALKLTSSERYTKSEVPKPNGKVRIVHNPHKLIRKIQRRINTRLFNPKPTGRGVVEWPYYIFGSVPNVKDPIKPIERDYIACARQHCLSQSILKIDITDFFDNIHIDHVYYIFRHLLDYSDEVCNVISDICSLNGALLQGALTSSYLACLCLFDVEPNVVIRLQRKGLRYTRLVDDITVSSIKDGYDFTLAKNIIVEMLESKDLPVNDAKTQIIHKSSVPLVVHGLRVNFKEPRLPSSEVSKIRASVKNIEQLAKERHYITTHAYRKDFNRCMGRVNKLKRIGHNQHQSLVERLRKILPLPSKKDIERCKEMVSGLESDFPNKKGHFWYHRRFYRANERITILDRTFKSIAKELRLKMKDIRPLYKD
ncbi:reverse transcriptase [Arsukibacterium sp. MJ3]|uniref:reverse transcriptase family protein n=1 Tax=Arsukibacterium sp. MJ3 TaxID=1632859 RepID=UPI00062705A4|nr:reverse transcriptase family protein [Arsukibacterium sp. MJ3]KKO47755.1 reverse transcriptase [Arsukibacterium sp. MJ3]